MVKKVYRSEDWFSYMTRNVTLNDIAREAGVSSQTVSRVLNNRPDVSPKTRHRIQAIIDQMGYQPNEVARSLSAKRTHMIGVIIGSLDRFGPRMIFLELDKQVHAAGYRLLPYIMHDFDPSQVERYMRELLAHQPDGVIWAVMEYPDHEQLFQQHIIKAPVPLVTIEAAIPGVPKPAFMDQVEASSQLVQHLIEQGYRNIGIITGQQIPITKRGSLREVGWRKALDEAGLPAESRQIVEGSWTSESGEKAIGELLAQYPEMDAVFACNDQMALGVLSYAYQHGIKVPDELGVVGFDDISEAANFSPRLTTMRQPFDKFAEITVQIMVDMIEAWQAAEDYTPPDTEILYAEFVMRQSSVLKRTNST